MAQADVRHRVEIADLKHGKHRQRRAQNSGVPDVQRLQEDLVVVVSKNQLERTLQLTAAVYFACLRLV